MLGGRLPKRVGKATRNVKMIGEGQINGQKGGWIERI
jgi:hypothetical protein